MLTTPRFATPPLIRLCILATLPGLFGIASAGAADWPMFGHDAQRTLATPKDLPDTLYLRWSLRLPRLEPAWPDQPRVQTDSVYRPIIVGARMIVASSLDDSMTAYELVDGRVAWRFITGGPIRYAPCAEGGRVFAGSDDGYLYAVAIETGQLIWKLKLAPQHRPVLGNGRIIDTWCVRGGPVVEQGKVYFAAGIWPFMGVFVGCADATTGKLLWSSSGDGSTFAKGPHSAMAFGTLSPQGPLALAGDRVLVPNGRAMPAVFAKATGQFQYFNNNNKVGGDRASAAGPLFFDAGQGFDPETGALVGTLPGIPVLTASTAYSVGVNEIRRFDLTTADADPATLLQKGGKKKFPAKKTELPGVRLAINAGRRLYAAGDGWIAALELPLKDKVTPVWKLPIDGKPADLVAAADCLLVTTDAGTIHCFGATRVTPKVIDTLVPPPPAAPVVSQTPTAEPLRPLLADAAASGGAPSGSLGAAVGGYGVVVGSNAETLASQLLRLGMQHVVIVEPDAARADALRRRLLAQRLGGRWVAVVAGETGSTTFPLPPCFASVVVVDETVRPSLAMAEAAYRVLHPYHGTALFLGGATGWQQPLTTIAQVNPTRAQVASAGMVMRLARRGGLPGAGQWTHENADPANTRSSRDAIVKAPLGVLWFGGSSNELILPRHGHGPQPQVVAGRIYIMGMDILRALDAYTGRILWEASLPGVGSFYNHTSHNPGANGTGANYVSTPDSVYVALGRECLRLDAATGRIIGRFKLPATPGITADALWSFVCISGDRLIGGASPPTAGPGAAKQEKDPEDRDDDPQHKHVVSNPRTVGSRVLFVMDRVSGTLSWSRPALVGEFRHNATAIGGGKLYTIDRPIARPETKVFGFLDADDDGPPPILHALDLATGREIWKTREKVFGTVLACSEAHDALVEAGRVTRDSLRDEPKGMRAYKASTGEVRWSDARLKGPIILRDKTLLSEGWGCDLLTGKSLTFADPITGADQRWGFGRANGCNAPGGSDYLLTFRSGAAGFYDLLRNGGTGNFGGFRSSCTNNLIIADGLICSPDYTRTCVCAFPIQTSVALVPDADVEMWTYQGASDSPKTRIKRLGINFGAPGDRVDDNGTFWLEYPPSPSKSPKINPSVEPDLADLRFFRQHASTVAGSLPWVAASGVQGLGMLTLDLKGTHQRTYTVRLIFMSRAEPATAGPGVVMDIDLQGKRVESNLDIAKAAGGCNRTLIREFRGVPAVNQLTVKLQSRNAAPTVLCGIEVVYEK